MKINPPIFTDQELQAIAQAVVRCDGIISRLVRLLQCIRTFRRYGEIDKLPPSQIQYIDSVTTSCDAEFCLGLYLALMQAGFITDNHLDLDGLAQKCLTTLREWS